MFFRKQKAVSNDNHAANVEPTIIGADATVSGNIETAGAIHVEGTISGTVRADSCLIAAGGNVIGEVIASEVMVEGRVTGPLQGNHVHLLNGSSVEGDITCDTIAIDTGARLSGAVWQSAPQQEFAIKPGSAAGEPQSIFPDNLWGKRQDDDYRPIAAVKPRLSTGSGYG
jgi:cytoskeletal protein CcmA (bactofilin family)